MKTLCTQNIQCQLYNYCSQRVRINTRRNHSTINRQTKQEKYIYRSHNTKKRQTIGELFLFIFQFGSCAVAATRDDATSVPCIVCDSFNSIRMSLLANIITPLAVQSVSCCTTLVHRINLIQFSNPMTSSDRLSAQIDYQLL